MKKTAVVVSDLHMFCNRSQWHRHLDVLHRAAAGADLFVFNGDTFDFKWSVLPSLEATVEAAENFLREFAQRHAKCMIHVNLGNHDHIPALMDALDRLSAEFSNLTWHPYFLRVNSTLFLHGDVANWRMNHQQLTRYRSRWMRHRRPGEIRERIYHIAFQARAHVAVSRLAFTRRRTVRKVAHYLEDIGHGVDAGIKHVCFGHTHVPVHGYRYRGVTFHNGGAPMKGIEFRILKVAV